MYAARPPRYTPLLRGETAADWRGEFRKALHKCNDSHGFRNKPRLHELQEARLHRRVNQVIVECRTYQLYI